MGLVEHLEAVPDAARTMEGLRDTGYDFETAIADIVDNSIAAHATLVDIRIEMDIEGNIRIAIADNGHGMNREGLILAMRYGAPRRADAASLGKYGLGLKTASTAFGRELSVVSRDTDGGGAVMATWDLDHVVATNKWDLMLTSEPPLDALRHLEEIAPSAPGTVVVWNKVDRLMQAYQSPSGGHATKALQKRKELLREHLAAVYQRFLDENDDRARNVEIRLDGKPVAAWDPFQTAVSELLANQTLDVDGIDAKFTVKAYVLPRREDFPTEEMAREAKLSSDRQGIYIYRQERLIHAADWLGMYQKEPHSTLLRVEFSFDHNLDDAFHLDIKKSKIILNEALWEYLKDQFLPAPRREANRRYRLGQKKDVEKGGKGAHDGSNRSIQGKENEVGGAEVKVVDPAGGKVQLTNTHGQFTIKLRISPATKPGEVFVQAASDVEDGILFEPAIIEGHKAVRINRDHPYYHKVYVPNFSHGVTMQGLDSLMWALSVAELSATTDKTADSFRDMRYEVSRVLRKLVEGLPEPDLNQETDVA